MKKGFSLIELIVTITILGILATVLVSSFIYVSSKSKDQTDDVAILNLETATQMAAQYNGIYKEAKEIAEDTLDNSIVMVYSANESDVLEFSHSYIKNENNSITTTKNNKESDLCKIENKILEYVGGSIEPITLEGKKYKNSDIKISIIFTDVEFKVKIETEVINH